MEIDYTIITKKVNESIWKNKTKIFNFIYDLQVEVRKLNSQDDKIILFIIEFDKEKIKIDPLFFILLINFFNEYKIIHNNSSMSINISNLDYHQGIVHRFLTHFVDMQYFLNIDIVHQRVQTINDIKYLFESRNVGLYIEQTTKYTSYPFTKDDNEKDKVYTTTPIIKVTNTLEAVLVTDNREDIYNIFIFNVEKSFKNVKDDYVKALTKIFKSLNMKNEIVLPFSNIFFEALHNIKKHTKKEDNSLANAYVNFRSNYNDDFEFLITDDADEGFLNKYRDILKNEEKDLKTKLGEKANDKLLSSYTSDIELLDNDTGVSDIKVLRKLFDIDNTFSTHQIPRLMMHFGIPLLLQILTKYPTSKLNIYLHRKSLKGNRFYCLVFENGKLLEGNAGIEKFSNGVFGTYIYMLFPKYKNIEFNGIIGENTIPITLKNTDYSTIFNLKDKSTNEYEIEKRIKNFQHITNNDLDDFNKPNIEKSIIIDYSEIETETIADFFRSVYLFAYEYEIKDIVLVNMPLIDEKDYFNTLIYILFSGKTVDEKEQYVRNLLFFDKASLNVLFIGGKNKKQFCSINRNILERYSQITDETSTNFCRNHDNESIYDIESELFFSAKKGNYMLLPFELYWKNSHQKMFLFQDVLNLHLELENNFEKIHVDTNSKYHLNKFYFLKYIFEDSVWINRIAYTLAQKIREEDFPIEANIVLIGIGQYSSLIVSIAHSLLELKDEYFVITDFNKLDKYKDFIEPRSLSDSPSPNHNLAIMRYQ